MENDSNNSDMALDVPKKIALKVPSLFITTPKPKQQSEDGNGSKSTKKKGGRPMPASAKKKLEETKQTDHENSSAEPLHNAGDTISSNDEDHKSKTKKISNRPMPASARLKLTEVETSKSTDGAQMETDSAIHTSAIAKRGRPMPASAKRKHDDSNRSSLSEAEGEAEKDDDRSAPEKQMPASSDSHIQNSDVIYNDESAAKDKPEEPDTKTQIVKRPSRPMPASAKRKQESHKHLDNVQSSSTSPTSRTVSDSATKLLELERNESLEDIRTSPKEADSKSPKTFCKAGPASSKQKTEKIHKRNSDMSDGPSNKTMSERNSNNSNIETPRIKGPMPASVRKQLENATKVDQVEEKATNSEGNSNNITKQTEEGKKINISLGGIKFPTFKKPMPASQRNKLKTQEKEDQEQNATDSASTDLSKNLFTNVDEAEDEERSPMENRRQTRSVPSKELVSLHEEKYNCQYCDSEFYDIRSKNNHEKNHFKVKDNPPKELKEETIKSGETTEKKVKKDNRNDSCPHCQRRVSNRKKLKKHIYRCNRKIKLTCAKCSKSFKTEKDFDFHTSQPNCNSRDLNTSQDDGVDPDTSINPDSPPSPVSEKSKSNVSSISEAEIRENKPKDRRSKTVDSFKRKIADVLSSLGAKYRKRHLSNDEANDNSDAEAPPPVKKLMLSDNRSRSRKNESSPSLAMPASVRKKLEERSIKEPEPSEDDAVQKDIDDLECEICHRVFSNMTNRQRHERTVHSLEHTRGSSYSRTKILDKFQRSLEKTPVLTSETKKEAQQTKTNTAKSLTTDDVPISGKCPICYKFIATRLRRHVRAVHKLTVSNTKIITKDQDSDNSTDDNAADPDPTPIPIPIKPQSERNFTKPSAPKSFKIYKSAANKAKKKLSSAAASSPKSVHSPRKENFPENSPNSVDSTFDDHDDEDKELSTPTPIVKETAKAAPASVKKTASSSETLSNIKCACCDETFTVKIDYNQHMTKRHPKMKRLFTCKLCLHAFTHEDDFILHLQFKHKELVSGMVKQGNAIAAASSGIGHLSGKSTNHNQNPSSIVRRNLRTRSRSGNTGNDFNEAAAASCPKCSIVISAKERKKADDMFKLQQGSRNKKQLEVSQSRSRGSSTSKFVTRERSLSPPVLYPEVYVAQMETDTFCDDGPPSPVMDMDADESSMDVEDSGIAITATFSQRVSPRKGHSSSTSNSSLSHTINQNQMPCSVCSQVFVSFEALKKHELYIHNLKTSRMCPICGIYPTKMSRHLLAHENKTVRCCCAPCRLNFTDFSLLRKHNLEHHPGTNASDMPNGQSNIKEGESETYRCKLCKKEITGRGNARRHVRRAHPEYDEPDDYVEKVTTEIEEDNDDICDAIAETNKTNASGWNSDDAVSTSNSVSSKSKPKTSDLQNTNTNAVSSKPARPMPASVRAKLEAQKSLENAVLNSFISIEDKVEKEKPKPSKRPMPASARAKLEAEAKLSSKPVESPVPETKIDVISNAVKPTKTPMPASIRAKLEKKKAQEEDEKRRKEEAKKSANSDPPKVTRPMPASARAKLLQNNSSTNTSNNDISSRASTCSSTGSVKISRPMPASARARMLNKAELKEVAPPPPSAEQDYSPPASPEAIDLGNDDSNHSAGGISEDNNQRDSNRNVSTPHEVVTLDDDDDDIVVVAESSKKSTRDTSFNIADEIAEHNRAVQAVIGDAPSTYRVGVSYKCKLCLKIFDSADGVRRHIRLDHSEYGPDHTENLFESVYQESASGAARKRRSNVNYNKSYQHEEDEENEGEDEVIVSRGTSTRPRMLATGHDLDYTTSSDPVPSPAISHSVENTDSAASLLLYACKICGQRKDLPRNVKRHIAKAHPTMKGMYDDEVVTLEPGREHEFVPLMKTEFFQQTVQLPVHAQVTSHSPGPLRDQPQPVAYKCKVCQKSMQKRASIMQHIYRSHPEVKQSATKGCSQFIQELYENDVPNIEVKETESAGERYTCIFCSFETTDESEYVHHYRNHTGVSPYQCQYCSATFNQNRHLTAHITREHTGAEFLNEDDEAEITMEEMVGVGEISVSTATPILIEQPQIISLQRRYSTETSSSSAANSPAKKRTPGPASKTGRNKPISNVSSSEEISSIMPNEGENGMGVENSQTEECNNPEPEDPVDEELEEQEQEIAMPYGGDLSSLFSSLGGTETPGGLADIHGGMELD